MIQRAHSVYVLSSAQLLLLSFKEDSPPSSRSLAPLPPLSLPSFSLLLDRSSSCKVASLLGAIPLALPAVPTDFVLILSSSLAHQELSLPFLPKREFQHLDTPQQIDFQVLC
jgi:hypothetical protein